MAMMAFCPTGILGLVQRGVRLVAARRKAQQPTLLPERTSS